MRGHRVVLLAGVSVLWATLAVAQVQPPVIFEVKGPGEPNPINVKSRGVLPVALMCTATFDPALVDVASLTLGPNAAPAKRCVLEDLNGDGCEDLECKFDTQALGVTCADTTLTLSGTLTDDTPVSETAPITPKPCQD